MMDAVQFGRWLAERRHLCGWPSQRALVAAARAQPLLASAEISEAFVARLEAGHLAHPFRGSVRQRVLLLAWLLCKNARDLRVYLRVSGLTELGADETILMERLRQRIEVFRSPVANVLPARSQRFVGREAELTQVMRWLSDPAESVVAITGLPGVGKSTLASEVAHRCADAAATGSAAFGDGVLYVDVAHAVGTRGLFALLTHITRVCGAARDSRAGVAVPAQETGVDAPALERAILEARRVLGSRDVLIVLDNVEAGFALREAVEALASRADGNARGGGERDTLQARRGMLFTSRFVPPPALMSQRLHLAPLGAGDAVALFAALIRQPLTDVEDEQTALICAALGHLPLAIEVAATAIVARGIPLDLLAAHVSDHPLDSLLDSEGDVRAVFARALAPLSAPAQQRLALLGAIGAPAFGIEWAASVQAAPELSGSALNQPAPLQAPRALGSEVVREQRVIQEDGGTNAPLAISRAVVARTASELGELVRHSLLDVSPGPALAATLARNGASATDHAGVARYQIHPLVAAFAREYLWRDHAEIAEAAHQDARAYALAYVAQHQADVRALEREREMLLATLTRAWQRHEDEIVVRMIVGLWRLIGRLGTFELSARILFWGVAASQRVNDRYHEARFLNRLGALFHYHGDSVRARQAWEASLRLAEKLRQPAEVWHPLANLALMACEAGDFDRARRLADTFLRRGQEDGAFGSVAHALFNRGLSAHLQGDDDQAFTDLTACTRLLALRSAGDYPAHDGILELAAQAELARVQGDFARARQHTEMAVTLAEEVSDHYTVADLLLDQARFARAQQRQDEARTLATRAVAVASRVEAHQLHQAGLSLLNQLPASASAQL